MRFGGTFKTPTITEQEQGWQLTFIKYLLLTFLSYLHVLTHWIFLTALLHPVCLPTTWLESKAQSPFYH
jgi:hypothetical protein